MKRTIFAFSFFVVVMILSAVVYAGDFNYGALYPNGDGMVIYSKDVFDGVHHLVVTNNAIDAGTSATVLNDDGTPSNAYGYYYYWAGITPTNPETYDLYGSNDGIKWKYIGTFVL